MPGQDGRGAPDIVLLDVMMPGMDGFEVCRRIKSNPKTAHVPVVMVTALDQPSDRVAGLDAGADDFLTKPVDDAALFARVRSLVRLKMMTDELRMRESTGQGMGLIDPAETLTENNQSGRILVIEDRAETVAWFASALAPNHEVSSADTFEEALVRVKGGDFDLIVVSLGMRGFDGLRLCSQLRSLPEGRHVPILVVVSDGDRRKLTQALEMGVNDYLTRPVDKNELVARVRTQLRKKRYADRLAPQCPAQPGNGDHRPAHRPAQSPLYEPPSRYAAGAMPRRTAARWPLSSWTSTSSSRSTTPMAMTSATRC